MNHTHSMHGLPLTENGSRPHIAVRCICGFWRWCNGDGAWYPPADDGTIIFEYILGGGR